MKGKKLLDRSDVELLLTRGQAQKDAFRHFGLTLFLVRELKGKSQSVLAGEIGFSKSQLSKYETGRCYPSFHSLERILSGLDMSPLAFFYAHHFIGELSSGVLDGSEDETPSSSSQSLEDVFQTTLQGLLSLYRALVTLPQAVRG